MLNLLKRKFTVINDKNDDVEEVVKRPRPSSEADPSRPAPPKLVGMARRIGRQISSLVSRIRTPNFRRAGTSRLFTTPVERQTIRYEMTPAMPLGSTATEWRSKSFYIFGDRVPVTENKHFEFKTGGGNYPITILPEHIRKYGSAFLNSEGGVLLAGILDDGRVQGIICSERVRKHIVITVDEEFGKFLPHVNKDSYRVTFVRVAQRGRHGMQDFLVDRYVLEVLVQPGSPGEIYEDKKHQVFIRREGSVEGPLTPLQIKDIVIEKYRQILNKRREERRKESQPQNDVQAERRVICISP